MITDTSEAQENQSEYDSAEVSASMEYGTPDEKFQGNRSRVVTYVALITTVENPATKDTARARSSDRIAINQYEDDIEEDQLKRIDTDREISRSQEEDSD